MGRVEELPLNKVVLDVLKPLKGPSIVDMALLLTKVKGVRNVTITVNEVDVETVTLTVTIEGQDFDFTEVKKIIEYIGGAIHSIDQVVASSD